MKKHLLALFAVLSIFVCLAHAQSDADKDEFSRQTFTKIRKIDLLFNILPVLYTKDQINKLLPALERAHTVNRETLDNEYDDYKGVDKLCDKSISDAIQQNILPTRQQRAELSNLLYKQEVRRQVTILKNVANIKEVFDKVMSDSQKKAAANSLDPRTFDPKAKPDEMTQDQKIEVYVREILLDQLTYDLLVERAKNMK